MKKIEGRLLKIVRCDDCIYCDFDTDNLEGVSYCSNYGTPRSRSIIKNIFTIPKWCPLPKESK
jgi:hypothetical protein